MRSNTERALGMLKSAGIDEARLFDGDANGQKVSRLRVGPLQAAAPPKLAARIVGLGFGQPQRVRDHYISPRCVERGGRPIRPIRIGASHDGRRLRIPPRPAGVPPQ